MAFDKTKGEIKMATLEQVKSQLNMGDRYLFDGTLFRDTKRNTATLYINHRHSHKSNYT